MVMMAGTMISAQGAAPPGNAARLETPLLKGDPVPKAGKKRNGGWRLPWHLAPVHFLAEYVMGLPPVTISGERIRVAPARFRDLPALDLVVPHPLGHITARYRKELGYDITAPLGVAVEVEAPEGVSVRVRNALSHRVPVSTTETAAYLKRMGWKERVGDGSGVWVSMEKQVLWLIEGGEPVWQARCATATNGTGSESGSMKTPLGWHGVAEAIGEGAPWGQVFRARRATNEIWKPGDNTAEDLVLTRVLVLGGEEPGKNQGRNAAGVNVDSRNRCIYIHGTNDESRIGTPSSHGCIRLLNDDVMVLFDRVAVGTPVLITERFPRDEHRRSK